VRDGIPGSADDQPQSQVENASPQTGHARHQLEKHPLRDIAGDGVPPGSAERANTPVPYTS
jgi:hypothetical protein